MVASTHWLASASGMAMLEAGGNAFDAAVAAGLVLQVVEPHLNGPGGEVPIIFYSVDRDEVIVVNGQGPAPMNASIDRFADLGLDLVPGTGLLAACTPGAFDAWMRLLADFGTLSLSQVMTPALEYAERGFPVVPRISSTIAQVESLFRREWPTSASTWLPGNRVPSPGTLLRNRDLATTYGRILKIAQRSGSDRLSQINAARDAFYRGFVAEAIVAFSSTTQVLDASGRRHAGLLSADDLAGYSAPFEPPATFEYGRYTVCKTGPWGQGPVFLQQLALLAGYDLQVMDPTGAEFVHTVVECAKLAFADREAWYGDPAFEDVPLAELLDPDYSEDRRRLVGARASLDFRPGSIPGRERLSPRFLRREAGTGTAGGVGEPTLFRPNEQGLVGGDTCHVDVADRCGNLLAATPSGGWLQSSPTVPGLGFSLGTRAQMFWLTDGLANSLAGGKRPRTTLTPSLVQRDAQPYLAFGTPGGDTQDQWSLVFFLRHVHHGQDLQAAIDAPMFHTAHFPSSFYPRTASPGEVVLEGRFATEVVQELRKRGHRVTVEGDWSLGRLSAVGREPDLGILKAAANARGMQGYAVGR